MLSGARRLLCSHWLPPPVVPFAYFVLVEIVVMANTSKVAPLPRLASERLLFCKRKSMIDKATERSDVATVGRDSMDDGLEKIRECVAAHNKAIQFFNFLDATNRMRFLLQVGLNMMGLSVTAFQAVMHLDDMKVAVRYAIFLGGQKFHLFFISLPGQVLSDFSAEVLDNIYYSKWYRTSPKMQRMMNIMQLRASQPCQLTAGGLYELNIQNFGAAFKTCMSYFTMLLSTKE